MLLHSFVGSVLLGLAFQLPLVAKAQADSDWKLSDSPAPDLFLRRALGRVTVLGNYAYIDGGEVSQLNATGQPITNRASNAVNSTLSIDMSKSWSASNVSIRTIDKPTTGMDGQVMLKSDKLNAFYVWGGHVPYGGKLDSPQSRKFEADGQGGGQWVNDTPANPSLFTELRRHEEAAFAVTPDAGFIFGGIASGWTNSNPYSQPVPGVLSYNMTTKQWINETTPGFSAFSKSGNVVGGGAVYIPTFGDNGLILVMGGASFTLEPSQSKPESWLDFNNLTFYDPITKDWYWQQTTGNAPTARRGFCYVGAEGKNGTYEIFLFGGTNSETGSTFDDVFVLSLPGFVWTQVTYESKSPRRNHACAVVGRRQMLSVGGADGKTGYSSADPFPQGLGLFDMTSWTWKTDYDADAKDYETAKEVQEWYQAGGGNEVKWSSDRVKAVFVKSTKNTTSEDGGKTTSTNNGDDENKTTQTEAQGGKTTVSTAVIVGVVVGVVVGLGLAFGAFWFLRRRKQRQAAVPSPTLVNDEPSPSPYYDPFPSSELHSHASHSELYADPTPKHEMFVPEPKIEMMGTHGHHFTVTELDAQQQQQQGLLRR